VSSATASALMRCCFVASFLSPPVSSKSDSFCMLKPMSKIAASCPTCAKVMFLPTSP